MCGYSLEVNVTSDLDLYVSSNQIHLLHDLVIQSMSRLYPTKSNKAADRSEENKDRTSDHLTIDSGIDSDASTVTHVMGNKTHATSALASSDQGQSSKVMTPFDILLTASRISCTLYGNKILDKDVEIDTKISDGRKIRKSDLEWKGQGQRNPSGSSTDTPKSPPTDSLYILDAVKEEEPIGFSFMNIHEITEPEKKTLHQGSSCSLPFLYLYISQPHTVLSCLDSEQKFEMSCYDILVKGPSAKYIAIGK